MAKRAAKKKTEGAKHLKEQLARALADYDNLRKRVEREREDFGRLVNVRLVVRMLPVYDMLEGAQGHLNDTGIAITLEEFAKVLKEEGIEKIETKPGDKFDEEIHEAVEVEDPPAGGKSQGKITKVILSGWKLIDGPVIRPVKVKAGKKGN
jgi:molecular chaperone GrpE